MCENANVPIKNNMENNQDKVIEILPDGDSSKKVSIPFQQTMNFFLTSLDSYLQIVLPTGLRIDDFCLRIGTDVDYIVNLPENADDFSYWTIRIASNKRKCKAPTTINVSVSDNRP